MTSASPRTLSEKVWDRHVVHEVTSPPAIRCRPSTMLAAAASKCDAAGPDQSPATADACECADPAA